MKLPLLTTLLLAPMASLHAADAAKPNILLILADDLGYGDLSLTATDPGETKNLHAQHPEIVARKAQKLEAIRNAK